MTFDPHFGTTRMLRTVEARSLRVGDLVEDSSHVFVVESLSFDKEVVTASLALHASCEPLEPCNVHYISQQLQPDEAVTIRA